MIVPIENGDIPGIAMLVFPRGYKLDFEVIFFFGSMIPVLDLFI